MSFGDRTEKGVTVSGSWSHGSEDGGPSDIVPRRRRKPSSSCVTDTTLLLTVTVVTPSVTHRLPYGPVCLFLSRSDSSFLEPDRDGRREGRPGLGPPCPSQPPHPDRVRGQRVGHSPTRGRSGTVTDVQGERVHRPTRIKSWVL